MLRQIAGLILLASASLGLFAELPYGQAFRPSRLAKAQFSFPNLSEFPKDRNAITTRLREKVAAGQPLVAHILVPLCDNEHQGIVKVNSSLGDGRNLRTNLYWGAGYGIRTHFQRQAEWKTLAIVDPMEPHILERIVLRRIYPNGATVVLIADAYDGAYMKVCIEDFLDALCGSKKGKVTAADVTVDGWAGADLLAFNGHNGLMDNEIQDRSFAQGKPKDAVVIACISHPWFEPHLQRAHAFPLVTTTNLLAPEGYILKYIIDAWAQLKSAEEVDAAAAQGNSSVQKVSLGASHRLFRTGWTTAPSE